MTTPDAPNPSLFPLTHHPLLSDTRRYHIHKPLIRAPETLFPSRTFPDPAPDIHPLNPDIRTHDELTKALPTSSLSNPLHSFPSSPSSPKSKDEAIDLLAIAIVNSPRSSEPPGTEAAWTTCCVARRIFERRAGSIVASICWRPRRVRPIFVDDWNCML